MTRKLLVTPELPAVIDSNRYNNVYHKLTGKKGPAAFFKTCYSEDRIENMFILKDHLTETERWELVRILIEYDESLNDVFNHAVAAYRFYSHRTRLNRIGDEKDDYYKAKYLLELINYFKQNKTRVIDPKDPNQLEDIICMVNNIFDYAFFLKNSNSDMSDIECFTEAERHYCKEKWIDHEAYFEYERRCRYGIQGDEKTDYETARKRYNQMLTEKIAYFIAENKKKSNLQPDPVADYYEAEKVLNDQILTQKIAVFCWYKHPQHNLPDEFYWGLSEQIVESLKQNNKFMDPSVVYNPDVQRLIENTCAHA